jgi:hypothetical protein
MNLRDRITCVLCDAATSGRLPYGIDAERWSVLRDTCGTLRAVCPSHKPAVAWASMRWRTL